MTEQFELTPEKEARFDEFVNKWTAIGLARSQTIDVPRIQAAVSALYAQEGQELTRVQICESPAALVRKLPSMRGHTEAETPTLEVSACSFGQFDAGWLSFYDYLQSVFPSLESDIRPLHPFIELAQCSSWAHLEGEVAYVAAQPSEIHLDARGELHSLTGPAIAWPDGWGAYCVRGRLVPDAWVRDRDQLDVQRALTERNLEHRSILQQILGWGKVLAKLETKVVHDSGNKLVGQLLETQLDGERARFLRAWCPANKHWVVIRVDPSIQTAQAASASTYPVPDFLRGTDLVTGVRL